MWLRERLRRRFRRRQKQRNPMVDRSGVPGGVHAGENPDRGRIGLSMYREENDQVILTMSGRSQTTELLAGMQIDAEKRMERMDGRMERLDERVAELIEADTRLREIVASLRSEEHTSELQSQSNL